jgi:ribosomal protein S12 methylthiotransferase RimO
MNKTKVGFISLGCPKNQVDTEVMLSMLHEAGYELTSEDIEADIIIVNTCAFIESAKKESIDNILDVAWLKENRSLKGIVVCGCMAQRYADEIERELPEVDGIVGTGSLRDIVEAVKTVERGEKYRSVKKNEELKLGGDRIITTPDYFAYLKVAEGCDNRCTYCAIPLIRGSFRSRPIEELVAEAKTLESLGVKELALIAQDTTRYGLDLYGDYKLAELIRAITEATSIPWLRLMYCYPDKITDELVAELRDNDRLVKYIDLPVQHISDKILTAMNRHGGSDVIRSAIKKLRDNVPGIIIRSTAIVGFPGETKSEFGELCEFIKEAQFDRFGAFAFSREDGTAAYDLPGQIAEQEKQRRLDKLMALQLEIHERKNKAWIGKTVKVLCEGYDTVSEIYFGRSYADASEIDGKVYFSADVRVDEGEFVSVEINEAIDYDLRGEKV